MLNDSYHILIGNIKLTSLKIVLLIIQYVEKLQFQSIFSL
jgi:hypothetical protein